MAIDVPTTVAALERLTVGELRQRYLEVFGEPTRSGNRRYLIKRIVWRMQAIEEGDLSERARRRARELARLGHATRARITQIMNLLNLAPDIQEQVLFLPLVTSGRDRIRESDVRPIAAVHDWEIQRRMWQHLCAARGRSHVDGLDGTGFI